MRDQLVIQLIEAAYATDGQEEEWLAGIAHAAARLIGEAPGIVVGYLEARDGRLVGARVATPGFSDCLPCLAQLAESALRVDCSRAALLLGRTGAFRCSELAAQLGSTECSAKLITRRSLDFGEVDALHVIGADGEGKSLCLHIGIPSSPSLAGSLGKGRLWRRVATHLAAAARRRRTLNPTMSPSRSSIGEPGQANASCTLRRAAELADQSATVDIDGGRGGAWCPWRGLIDGHWVVMDAFDGNGRRILVLGPNAPELVDDSRLTRRERQVIEAAGRGSSETKTALSLGISPSTVRTHLARAMTKLRIARISDLIVLFSALQPSPAPLPVSARTYGCP